MLLSGCSWAQDGRSHHVEVDLEAEDGTLHFDGYLCRSSPLWKEGIPEIYGTITSDRAIWRSVGVLATLNRANGTTLDRRFIVRSGLVPWKSAPVLVTVISDIASQGPGCDIASSNFELLYAISEASVARDATEKAAEDKRQRAEEAAEEKRRRAEEAAKANAAKKKAADDAAHESARLAKFPVLHSGLRSAFLGADKKCAEQFQQALAMDGLEKRKRITDLVSYNCGVVVDDAVHVALLGAPVGGYRLVSVEEGRDRFTHGWVPESWLK